MPQKFHRFGPENTFVLANDETSRKEALEDTMEMALMFIRGRGEDQNIINVDGAEGEVTKNVVHHSLKGGPGIVEAEVGVIKSVCTKGGDDGGLWNVSGIHGNLIVTLQEVQLRKYLCPMKIGHDISEVWEGVVIWLGHHVESPVVAAEA